MASPVKIAKDKNIEDVFEQITRYKSWNAEYEGEADAYAREVIESCVSLLPAEFSHTYVKTMARLARYASRDEYLDCFVNYIRLRSENGGKFGNTLDEFVASYGASRGAEKFAKATQTRINGGKASTFTKSYHMKNGMTENEARDKVSRIQRNNALKAHANHPDWSDFCRRSNPICVEYWINLGYTDTDEIYQLRRPYLAACPRTLEAWVDKLGEDEGRSIYAEITVNIQRTLTEKYGPPSKRNNWRSASKQSLLVFGDVMQYCDESGIQYYCGVDDNTEYWCRDYEDNNKYYFYDFVIPELNVVIEYNGVQWHPKTKESFERHGVLKDKYESLVEYDRRKIESARISGFDVLVIWNDEEISCAIERCINFIRLREPNTRRLEHSN